MAAASAASWAANSAHCSIPRSAAGRVGRAELAPGRRGHLRFRAKVLELTPAKPAIFPKTSASYRISLHAIARTRRMADDDRARPFSRCQPALPKASQIARFREGINARKI